MNDKTKPPLADDPAFLAKLSELDVGLQSAAPTRPSTASARPLAPRTVAPPSAQAPSPTRESATAPVVPRQSGGHRTLLDLFPPTPAAATAAPPSPLLPLPALGVGVHPPAAARPAIVDVIAPRPAASAPYEAFYGLNEPPFSASADLKFLYHSTAHDLVAQELLSAIRRRDAVVIVTGEAGIGKTMLCRAVLEQIDRRTLTSIVLDPSESIENILQTVLIDFGVISRADLAGGRMAHASRRELTAALREFLTSLGPLQAFAVVIVDDAHRLAADALDEIRQLSDAEDGTGLLQIVLVGERKLEAVLERTELRPLARRASVRAILGPLAEDEIADYVLQRLAAAGSNPRVEFEDEAFDRLYELSAGVPDVVNVLCDRALTRGFSASASVIGVPLIDRAAEELDIAAPESFSARLARTAATIVALLILMLVGAGAAAFVFHDRLSQTMERWQTRPAASGTASPAPAR